VAIAALPGTPIAGYARWSWRSEGERDPLHARALILSQPGCTVGLVSLELLLVPRDLATEVASRVADLKLDHLAIVATHTHAGPGGYWDNLFGERIATGPYDAGAFQSVAGGVAEALRKAAATRSPATLALARGENKELAKNRGGGPVDGRLAVLEVRGEAVPIAEVIVYPAHPSTLGAQNRLLSGDWPGELMRAREKQRGGVTLFLQGAEGDQSPTLRDPEKYAAALSQSLDGLIRDTVRGDAALSVATAEVGLPPPFSAGAPEALRKLASNLMLFWFPAEARVSVLRLGGLSLLLVPAEPVTEVAGLWRKDAGEPVEVISLAGDYLGYVETPERMAAGQGETRRTYFGPELAARLGEGLRDAARAAGAVQPN
jgi:hypothetical protein